MPAAVESSGPRVSEADLLRRGVGLLNQQVWCWGRDVVRAEGNWLVEAGFERLEAPADREHCSSVYTLELPTGRRVVLRGFGVFYGDDRLGGVFLRRYEFRPRYTPLAKLECPPWLGEDLPKLGAPDASRRDACVSLALDLIDWIAGYEADVGERLGVGYRQTTLDTWEHAKQPIIPADAMADAWRALGAAAAANTHALVPSG